MIYQGAATLTDGERREIVTVTLRSTDGARGESERQWGGRILSNCDWAYWSGNLISIDLPTGGKGQVVVERSGVLTGFGQAPFGD